MAAANGAAPIDVAVTVRNTGSREGAEVVQVYSSQHDATVTPPVKRLRRFVKLTLVPGESRELHFRLDASDLSYIGPANKPVAAAGPITVMVGALHQDVTLR